MNSLYPQPDCGDRSRVAATPSAPDPTINKAEIDYLVQLFRVQTEFLRRSGQLMVDRVPTEHQPDLPPG
jgi:hypothetical protein